MITQVISSKASDLIKKYQAFTYGNAVCGIPYFNNKTTGLRGALRVEIGKGTPQEIHDEVELLVTQQKISKTSFTNESLKKFLIANKIGIDCSGFTYIILNEESQTRGKGALDKHLSFPFSKGFLGSFKAKMRPIENTNVQTLAHYENSTALEISNAQVGDMITLLGGPDGGERDHVLVVDQVQYENNLPTIIHYVHAIAWPTDGEYGHGIHEGTISIVNIEGSLRAQHWVENGKTGEENYTYSRAEKSQTELRRLNWF